MLAALSGGYVYVLQVFAKRLPDGVRVRVDAVGSSRGDRYWSPSGGRVSDGAPFASRLGKFGNSSVDPRLRHVIVTVDGVSQAPSSVCRFADGPVRTPELGWNLPPQSWHAIFAGNSRDKEVTLGVGVADGPWVTEGSVIRQSGGKIARKGAGFFRVARPWIASGAPKGQRDEVIVDGVVPTDLAEHAYRVVAFDHRGVAHEPIEFENKYQTHSMEYTFTGRYSDITRVELQARPYTWLTFSHVRLNPK